MRTLPQSLSVCWMILGIFFLAWTAAAFVPLSKSVRSARLAGVKFSLETSPRSVCVSPPQRRQWIILQSSPSTLSLTTERDSIKQDLLQQISATPSNAPTSRAATQSILKTIRELETQCPMEEAVSSGDDTDTFLKNLAGNWELLWTTQDEKSDEWNLAGPLRRWINPLENQAYSNNPLGDDEEGQTGRANPILPRPIQDRLEAVGVIDSASSSDDDGDSKTTNTEPLVRSSQSIDIVKGIVRNVVAFRVPFLLGSNGNDNPKKNKPTTVTLTVLIAFQPDANDARKINVKFESCRIRIRPNLPLPLLPSDVTIPLGIVGPSGWLRTTYLDDSVRITRGFKGSVFVLQRP